ncbi:hypothetical protein [Spiroplasma endosymbiont of Phycita roborella]|uniref:hypothetical protein n=1 Tax=Spiroplasma endosymbiont of Phycita roborella TaxID=3066311 RepID=UPI00313E6871
MNRCTFTQTTKFTSLIPPHDEHFEQIQCENMTEEQFDEYGRAYCKEHRNKVDEINKSRHKNCISKEKLIKYLKNEYEWIIKNTNEINDDYWHGYAQGKLNFISLWDENIKKGEFDNE